MKQVKLVVNYTPSAFEHELNKALKEYGNRVKDFKIAGGYDGKEEIFIAILVFEE